MNTPAELLASRQFWAGVAATVIVGILVAMGAPNLMRSRLSFYDSKQAAYPVRTPVQGYAGGGSGEGAEDRLAISASLVASEPDRKMVRTASIDLLVNSPKDTSERIRSIAEESGGFLVSSETYGGENAASAGLTVRIPADKFEQVRARISKLGVRVESEKLQAEDVTKQYVDLSARLRNLRAQELQYLGILKQARTIKDTVEVSDKLNDVRSQIEQQQAEFDALSKQVETVALTVSLHSEADAEVFGLHWRPLYRIKLAARDGIDGIGDYASAMAAFLFYIPSILLWLATILIGLAIAWKILRWAWRLLFTLRAAGA
jgi:cell division protein FtsL